MDGTAANRTIAGAAGPRAGRCRGGRATSRGCAASLGAAAGSLSPRGHHLASRGGRVRHRAPWFRLPAGIRHAALRVAVLFTIVGLAAGPLALPRSAAGALPVDGGL